MIPEDATHYREMAPESYRTYFKHDYGSYFFMWCYARWSSGSYQFAGTMRHLIIPNTIKSIEEKLMDVW